jgi:acetylornithine/N-succinyldiaminopimelate aminotransferase
MKKLVHVSNLYATEPALELGLKLTASGANLGQRFSAVHFGNSGTEANEAAIKYARAYAKRVKGEGCYKLLSFEHAFHGRTLGALAVTPSPAYQEPFAPLMGGVETAPFNDVEALERTLDRSFAGVLVEVIQGEGGLMSITREFAAALNRLCELHDIILIADEVQTGLGRTGTLFACEGVSLKPDIVTLAKPLAGGLPLSATLIAEKAGAILQPGDHGSTFGGGPVTTAVAGRVWDIVSKPKFLAWVRDKGEVLGEELAKTARGHSQGDCRLGGVRGKGLLRGLELIAPEEKTADIMKTILTKAREKGLLVLRSGKNIIRVAPPLVITAKEIQCGAALLDSAVKETFSALG